MAEKLFLGGPTHQASATLRRWDERAEKVAQLDGSVESCMMRVRTSEGSEVIVAAIIDRVVWREPTAPRQSCRGPHAFANSAARPEHLSNFQDDLKMDRVN